VACGIFCEGSVAVARFLKQRAVNIAVDGHYTLANWYDPLGKPRTFACRTNRVSPFRMMVDVPVVGKIGDHLTTYFRDFGKLDGCISDTRPGCFLLELDMTFAMRERFANKLTWLEEKLKDPGIPDLRRDARIIPASPHSTVTLADGSIHACLVFDLSASGVAVSAEVQPQIGTPLAVGTCVGARRQTFARRLCSQVRRTAEPPRSRPAVGSTHTTAFRAPCGGCALSR
jgi:hypothetical protein